MDEKRTILVVDDMPTICEQAINECGDYYNIITSGSGEEALEIIKEQDPDLILLDVYMPDSDGYDLVRKIRVGMHKEETPIIIMTTDASVVMETKGFSQGVSDFIRKPLVREIMIRKIDTQLQLKEYRAWKSQQDK